MTPIQQAIQALERLRDAVGHEDNIAIADAALAALRAVPEQPQQPDSVHVTSADSQGRTTDALGWQPMNTAPTKHGAEVLGWFRKVKLDEDDNLTDEVVGGAMAQISRNGDGWTEPDWLDASGAYFFDDFSFESEPVLWHALPSPPASPVKKEDHA